MKIRYPYNMTMHHNRKTPSMKIFKFLTEKDYDDAIKDGWRFNPKDLEPVKKEVQAAETITTNTAETTVKTAKGEEPKKEKPEPTVVISKKLKSKLRF